MHATRDWLHATRGVVSCSTFSGFDVDGTFRPEERRAAEMAGVLDQLETLTSAVQTLQS